MVSCYNVAGPLFHVCPSRQAVSVVFVVSVQASVHVVNCYKANDNRPKIVLGELRSRKHICIIVSTIVSFLCFGTNAYFIAGFVITFPDNYLGRDSRKWITVAFIWFVERALALRVLLL